MMKNFKDQIKVALSVFLTVMVMMAAVSCSKDDNDVKPGKGSDASGWFKADGTKTEFKYGYVEYDSYGMYVGYSTYDLKDVYANPSKYVGKKGSMLFIWNDTDEVGFEATIDGIWTEDSGYDEVYLSTEGSGAEYEFDADEGDRDYDTFRNMIKKDGDKFTVKGSIVAEKYRYDKNGSQIESGTSDVEFNFSGKPSVMSDGIWADSNGLEYVTDPGMSEFLRSMCRRH